ncbi:hypothetical protein [Streptomyces sp. NBC_00470]|uniref:hypothetical protein n=1 Tax=Streptomyces sp. NBC_00470 TaxID=2975753 RepID=UPI002F90E507
MTEEPLLQQQVDDAVLQDIRDLTVQDVRRITTFISVRGSRVINDRRRRAKRLREWPAVFTGRAAARAEETVKVAVGMVRTVDVCKQALLWMLTTDLWNPHHPVVTGTAWIRLALLWEHLVLLAEQWREDDEFDAHRWRGLTWTGNSVRAAAYGTRRS